MKKKILFLIKTPPPLTGATLMNYYSSINPLIKDRYLTKIIAIHYVDNLKDLGNIQFKKILIFIKLIFNLIYEIFSYRPNIIYFQISPLKKAFLRDLVFVSIIKLFKIKIIYHLHGKGIKDEVINNSFKRFLYKYAFKNEYIICLTQKLTDDISMVYNDKPFIVSNGIEKTAKTKPTYKTKNSPITILYFSNLFKSKGIFDLIKAFSILNTENIDFKGLIVGKEGDITEQELKKAIEKENLTQKVEFLGPRYGKDKEEIMLQIDILVHPTHNDIFGLVIIEAFQYGIPVVSTFEGAIPEIITDGQTGYLYPKGNINLLVEKLKLLISDEKLRHEMGLKAQKIFDEKYSLDIYNQTLFKVFKEILN